MNSSSSKKPSGTPYTVFIGDIHGCFQELQALYQKVTTWAHKHSPTSPLQFILLGDLIGKGPHSYEVVKWAYENQSTVIMGNHELSYLQSQLPGSHQKNPQHPQYPTRSDLISPSHPSSQYYQTLTNALGATLRHFISSLPLYYVTEKFIAVHAGIHPTLALHECSASFLTNVRTIYGIPWHEHYTGEKLVCYGHWAKQGLSLKKNTIGLDSGCVYGRKLSAYILETQTLLQVPALKCYSPL